MVIATMTILAVTDGLASNSSRALGGALEYVHEFVSNRDGIFPQGGLSSDGTWLYGVTRGSTQFITSGGLYAYNPALDAFRIVHEFDQGLALGIFPVGVPIVVDGTIFGATERGGVNNGGVIYAIESNGANYRVLHEFDAFKGPQGSNPLGGLTFYDDRLFGTTNRGGETGGGILYSLRTDGSDFQILHHFNGQTGLSDGRAPVNPPIVVDRRLIGTTAGGGQFGQGQGVVYSVNPDGSDFRLLHEFAGIAGGDGASAGGGLTHVGDRLYGTTSVGGATCLAVGCGTIYTIKPDGSEYALLHDFSYLDGYQASHGVAFQANRLYGVTYAGGPTDGGVAFSLNLDGSDFRVLHAFLEAPEGDTPAGPLVPFGNGLFGATISGGADDAGTIFAIAVPEPSSLFIAITAFLAVVVLRLHSSSLLFSRRVCHVEIHGQGAESNVPPAGQV
jgi:uncharacterized repeat protein (TIGR03803 family)